MKIFTYILFATKFFPLDILASAFKYGFELILGNQRWTLLFNEKVTTYEPTARNVSKCFQCIKETHITSNYMYMYFLKSHTQPLSTNPKKVTYTDQNKKKILESSSTTQWKILHLYTYVYIGSIYKLEVPRQKCLSTFSNIFTLFKMLNVALFYLCNIMKCCV